MLLYIRIVYIYKLYLELAAGLLCHSLIHRSHPGPPLRAIYNFGLRLWHASGEALFFPGEMFRRWGLAAASTTATTTATTTPSESPTQLPSIFSLEGFYIHALYIILLLLSLLWYDIIIIYDRGLNEKLFSRFGYLIYLYNQHDNTRCSYSIYYKLNWGLGLCACTYILTGMRDVRPWTRPPPRV